MSMTDLHNACIESAKSTIAACRAVVDASPDLPKGSLDEAGVARAGVCIKTARICANALYDCLSQSYDMLPSDAYRTLAAEIAETKEVVESVQKKIARKLLIVEEQHGR